MFNRPILALTVLMLSILAVSTAMAAPPAGPGATAAPPVARPGLPNFGAPNQQEQTYGDSRDKVTISARVAHEHVPAGSEQVVAVIMDIADGWHIWTNEREIPDTLDRFDSAVFTTINVSAKPESALDADTTAVQWPPYHGVTVNYGAGPETYAFFEDRTITYVVVRVPENAPPGKATITVDVGIQSCDASTCLRPANAIATASFEVTAPVTNVQPFDFGTDPDFTDFDASQLTAVASPQGDPETGPEQPAPTVTAPPPSFFGFQLPRAEGFLGILLIALMSILGGFILNLTPCVLPIIPIKIMTISSHANSPHRTLMLGWWMAIGVVAFWVAIGLPVIMFRTFSDPSRIFGIWWLTAGIGALIGLMGIGIMGLFTINLPQAVYSVNPKAETAWGSFLFGVMTGVLGLPCFGFVAGALLAGTATLPAFTIMTIFTCLGIGMAAPYLVLSAKPGLVDKIPRTGPGSELVKQVMGLLLLAAAAYFIGSGLIALTNDYPYVAEQLPWWAVALFAVLAGVWLMYRTIQITSKFVPRAIFAVMGLTIAGIATLYAIDTTSKARDTYETKQAAIDAADTQAVYIPGIWNEYSPAAFEKARADGKIVVLDFTAVWCLTCKALKATVLTRNPVKDALTADDVITFTVDLTSTKAPGWDYLYSLGQTGIPLLVIYTPGEEQPWLQNGYTSEQVMRALAEAREVRSIAKTDESLCQEYSQQTFAAAREAGQLIVVDFGAAWELQSKAVRSNALEREAVQQVLTEDNVISMRADLTSTAAPGWKLFQKLGKTTLPVLAVFTPNAEEPRTLTNLYSENEVVDAINAAEKNVVVAGR